NQSQQNNDPGDLPISRGPGAGRIRPVREPRHAARVTSAIELLKDLVRTACAAEPSVVPQPLQNGLLPAIAGHQIEAMLAFLEESGRNRHARPAQCVEEDDTVFRIDQSVVDSIEDQGGWGLTAHLQFTGEKPHLALRWMRAEQRSTRIHMRDFRVHADYRIDDDQKVRAQADMLGIGDISPIEMSCQSRGYVPAGGEADRSNACGIEVPRLRMQA